VRGRAPEFSKTQVRKAGKTLRRIWTTPPGEITEDDFVAAEYALTVAEDWRACHAYPLQKARAALQMRLGTVGVEGDVSQRLKRVARIIPKLARYPAMQLDTMQDIGGCRAVVPTQNDVTKVMRNWKVTRHRVTRVDDYVKAPRDSGYRAIHLIVDYDDRPIEMQLRTKLQHDWAYTVETWSGRVGADLKSGEGPVEALDFLAALSEGMALDESGRPVPPALMQRIQELGTRFFEATQNGGDR
jgi:putative GTP pyrophosphokinase